MGNIRELLENNRNWSESVTRENPNFFSALADQQNPDYLWIGCSDSRVSANTIVGLLPGEIFVHRNVANLVNHTDMNCLSVIQFAVEVLKVDHIIVCGHYGCGGVKAAMNTHSYGIINKWLRNIKDVYRIHRDEIDAHNDPEERANKLVEFNVKEQVFNLAKTSIVQKAWKEEQRPEIHGWVYGLKDGILKPIFIMGPGSHIDPLYTFDNL